MESDYVAAFLNQFEELDSEEEADHSNGNGNTTTKTPTKTQTPTKTPTKTHTKTPSKTQETMSEEDSDLEIASPTNLLRMPLALLRKRTKSARTSKLLAQAQDPNAQFQLEIQAKMREQARNSKLAMQTQGVQELSNKEKYQRDKLVSDSYLDRQRRKAEEIRRKERQEDGDYEDELPDDEDEDEEEDLEEEEDVFDSEREEEEEEEEEEDEVEVEEQKEDGENEKRNEDSEMDVELHTKDHGEDVVPDQESDSDEEPFAATITGHGRVIVDNDDEPSMLSQFGRLTYNDAGDDRQQTQLSTLTTQTANCNVYATQNINVTLNDDPELATAVDTQKAPNVLDVQTQVVSHKYILKPEIPQAKPVVEPDSQPSITHDISQEQRELREQFLAQQELEYQPTPSSQLPSIVDSDDEESHQQRKRTRRLRLMKDYEEERLAAKRQKLLRQKETTRQLREMRKQLDVLQEEASESEDEYAGAGGQDGEGDDEEDSDSDKDLEDLVDANFEDTHGDGTKLQKLYAKRQLEQDEEALNEVERIVDGRWRRGEQQGLDFVMDLNRDELLARKRQAIEKSRQKRIFEEQRLTKLAENPKASAFMDTIADADVGGQDNFVAGVAANNEEESQNESDSDNASENADDQSEQEDEEVIIRIPKSKSKAKPKKKTKMSSTQFLRNSLAFLNDLESGDEQQNDSQSGAEDDDDDDDDDKVIDPASEIKFTGAGLSRRNNSDLDKHTAETHSHLQTDDLDWDEDLLDVYNRRPLLAKKVGSEQREAGGVVITHSIRANNLKSSTRSWSGRAGNNTKQQQTKKLPKFGTAVSALSSIAQGAVWDQGSASRQSSFV